MSRIDGSVSSYNARYEELGVCLDGRTTINEIVAHIALDSAISSSQIFSAATTGQGTRRAAIAIRQAALRQPRVKRQRWTTRRSNCTTTLKFGLTDTANAGARQPSCRSLLGAGWDSKNRTCYSDTMTPDPPISFGTSINFGNPSLIRSFVS